MIDYQRLLWAANVSIAPLGAGYLLYFRETLEPLIDGTNTDPYTLDTASLNAALVANGASDEVLEAFAPHYQLLAYRYTVGEVVSLPSGIDPAVLDALITAKVTVATANKLDKSVYDKNNDGKVDVENQNDAQYPFTTPALQWVQPHSFGRIPDVTVLDTAGNQISADVRASLTSVIVEFGAPTAGQLILR